MPDAISIRSETAGDAAFRVVLFREAHGGILAGLDPVLAETLLRHQMAGQAMTYAARYPEARHEIVEVDGGPVGRLVVDVAAEALTLVDIALLAAWRGRGIGTLLLRDLAVEAGRRPVLLSVRADNVAARRLYARLGFEVVDATATDIAMRLGRDAPYGA